MTSEAFSGLQAIAVHMRQLGVERVSLELKQVERNGSEFQPTLHKKPKNHSFNYGESDPLKARTERIEKHVALGSVMSGDEVQRLNAKASIELAHNTLTANQSSIQAQNRSTTILPKFQSPARQPASFPSRREDAKPGNLFFWGHPSAENRPDIPEERQSGSHLFEEGIIGGPFYGNYFGPTGSASSTNEAPVSPVDRAAYYHDTEYFHIAEKYGYSLGLFQNNAKGELDYGWVKNFFEYSRPEMQLELANADFRMVENTLSFAARGLRRGFYNLDFSEGHVSDGFKGWYTFANDILFGYISVVFHSNLGLGRMALYTTYSLGHVIDDFFSGQFSRGFERLYSTAVNLVTGAAYLGYAFMKGGIDLAASGVIAVGKAVVNTTKRIFKEGKRFLNRIKPKCYVTTVCMSKRGFSDSCEELRLLRKLRDEYVVHQPGGNEFVQTYYQNAPRYIATAQAREDYDTLMDFAYFFYVCNCVDLIRKGQMDKAYQIYRDLYCFMQEPQNFINIQVASPPRATCTD